MHDVNSKDTIEISPAFLPSKRIEFLTDAGIRRIFLSATLTSEVDFCRAFGKRPAVKIEPESDAGVGERLIILGERGKLKDLAGKEPTPEAIAATLAATNKLLITTASYAGAAKFKKVAVPPPASEFSGRLEQFRKATEPGAFVLVARVDGIDLPHATCRVMLADGIPAGFSHYETYLFDFLEMRNSFAAKLANRITQMFGRTNRGRNDYSVIFSVERKLVAWLSTPRNLALLPELLRKQILLGKALVKDLKIDNTSQFPILVSQVLGRDHGWLKYYKDSISGLELTDLQITQARDNDGLLTEAALAEAEFGAQLWDGNASGARAALSAVVDRVVVADRRLAGWHNIQIGLTYELEGDAEAAAKQFAEARSRTNFALALPVPQSTHSLSRDEQPRNQFHSKLLDIFGNDIRLQNDKISKYERLIKPLFDSSASAGQHEEALRSLGELLGFDSTRPEQEDDTSSTLDVLWIMTAVEKSLLFELKTKKRSGSVFNMEEIGQSLQHLEWARSDRPAIRPLGVMIVADCNKLSREASPSTEIWISNTSIIKSFFEELIQTLLSLQRMPPLERYAEINSLCARPEWQADAIFERLQGLPLNALERSP